MTRSAAKRVETPGMPAASIRHAGMAAPRCLFLALVSAVGTHASAAAPAANEWPGTKRQSVGIALEHEIAAEDTAGLPGQTRAADPAIATPLARDVRMQDLPERAASLLAALGIEMVDIPGGTFRMGDLRGGGDTDEKPVHRVTVEPFRMSRHEVTFVAWDACIDAGGCSHWPYDGGWGRADRPVVNVSWNDAQAFLAWLNRETGARLRLPSEAEWEYAARAGTETKYAWGDAVEAAAANCADCGSRHYYGQTAPVGSFPANAFGLHDMHGNVWEWTADCWNESYAGAPADGTPWLVSACTRRVVRGGSWYNVAEDLRAANRSWGPPAARLPNHGFRLAHDR